MRILGVDCGSARTGYGVIESDGRDHRMLVSGTIVTNTRAPFEQRLLRNCQRPNYGGSCWNTIRNVPRWKRSFTR